MTADRRHSLFGRLLARWTAAEWNDAGEPTNTVARYVLAIILGAIVAAYLIFEISINDPEHYESYRSAAGPILSRHNGRFMVRSVAGKEGRMETLEGGWDPERFFVVAFPSWDQARAFYFSDAYQNSVKARFASSVGKAILVEGMPWTFEDEPSQP